MQKQLKNRTLKSHNLSQITRIVIFSLHIGGAFALSLFFIFLLSHLGSLGEISSAGILFLWKSFGAYFLSSLILILSIFVITLSNPVYALICLIVIFFSAAVFLLTLNVNFLAMIYLIIYIGAIAILFLFVIMMFNLRELTQQSTKLNNTNSLVISFVIYFLGL
jgi:hypothetical protein